MEISTIVIDIGAYSTRAGFGGEYKPQVVIPTVIGKTKTTDKNQIKNIFVGNEVIPLASSLSLKCPITDRIITSIDDVEALLSNILTKELNIKPEEHPVLLTESPQNTKQMREKTTQIMMETFAVPAFYASLPGVLALYANGQTTGLTIDAGETITHVLPVFECYGMTHCCEKLSIGGRSINNHLKKLITDRQSQDDAQFLPQGNEREIIRNIKENHCYVARDMNQELHIAEHLESPFEYTLPDNTKINLSTQRFMAPEIFFKPQTIGVSSPGLDQIVADVISNQIDDEDLRPEMMKNILLTGGSSMFTGLDERLKKDLSTILQQECEVIAPENRKNSAWIGGSVMVSLATFSQMWVTKAEYDEIGPEIIHLKCF